MTACDAQPCHARKLPLAHRAGVGDARPLEDAGKVEDVEAGRQEAALAHALQLVAVAAHLSLQAARAADGKVATTCCVA